MQNRFAANDEGASDPRHEIKFYISRAGRAQLRRLLGATLDRDRHGDANNQYLIRSLYFDDAYDSAFRDKLDGVESREKYRIRIYNLSDETIYLERKRKRGMYIDKRSVRITRRLCDQLSQGRPDGLFASPNPLLQDFFRAMRTRVMRPVVLVDYAREAYTHPAENVRITFDTGLRTGLFRVDLFDRQWRGISPLEEDKLILEVKYDRYLPDYIAAMLRTIPSECCAISKYTLCRRFEPLGG